MNKKQKTYMNEQRTEVYEKLTTIFSLPVFENEIAKDELPNPLNGILVVYGDFYNTDSIGRLYQEVYVVYLSEDKTDVEEITLDMITTVAKIKGFNFHRTIKERIQKDETDDFIDQVTIIFRRKLSHEC